MDKNAIKKYAVWARNELIARVTQKAEQYEITEKSITPADEDSIGGRVLTSTEKKQRQALIAKIKQDGFGQVMEEVAYTWFNRFTALRFMEVNNYLPSHTRVFTNERGEFKPQILADAISLDLEGLDMEKVYELKDTNKTEELYKYLLITQCNALSSILPGMFQKIEDYTELLLPDYLLREDSAIERLIADIPEDNFNVETEGGQIEIIGWLYQYYISEKHEEVVDPLHGKVVKKEEVPAATQLFTTDWVVRYLIDNSVGRYWIERNPESQLADKLTYFVKPKNEMIKTVNEKVTPQDVTTFDPCVGSGHFLIYAFDVLMKIYVEYGYSEREAATEIVKNNLFGLDVDGRATQLAYFSVMMKARQYDRRFFTRGIQPNVYEIAESNNADKLSIEYFYGKDIALKKDVEAILDVLKDAKEYGSILQIPEVNYNKINERFEQITSEISMYNPYLLGDFKALVCPAELMSKKYAVVATNPPYLNKYDSKLKEFINNNYRDYNGDLFSVFMYRNFGFCVDGGYSGFMTPFVWMFIKTYEKLRNFILEQKSIESLIQMEYSAFEEATVPICTFVLKNALSCENGYYFRLTDFRGGMKIQQRKVLEAISNPDCGYYYETDDRNFLRIPGGVIAYWIPSGLTETFGKTLLSDIVDSSVGIQSGDNDKFIHFWWEVNSQNFYRNATCVEESFVDEKWFPYNKGGNYRKWYGNDESVIDWRNDGEDVKENSTRTGHHYQQYKDELKFRPLVTWSRISSGSPAFRYKDSGFLSDMAGFSIYTDSVMLKKIIAFCNSHVAKYYLAFLSPTINFMIGQVTSLPLILEDKGEDVTILADKCIDLSKTDWDSFESSWDFSSHPLVSGKTEDQNRKPRLLSDEYHKWEKECESRFSELKSAEEELNRIFIDIYGLSEELIPEVEDKDVTVRRADLQRDIRSLISYAIGCMFGRYTLDMPGLAFAGGTWDKSKYKIYMPDKDGIIPICDDEYFDDDIVGRFVEFIEIVYGRETLEENLKFIANALDGRGSARETIRNYFINDFYADHVKLYQKRPIYWLFDSGKKNGFKCLIYMHRYQSDTIARIRTDYVHEQQSRYRTAIADLEQRINGASTSDRVKLNKQLSTLKAQADEIRKYEEKIHHLADQMISIDLDDGVKHNYEIFKDVLAKIK